MKLIFRLSIFCVSLVIAASAYAADGIVKYVQVNWRSFPPYAWENQVTHELEGFRIDQVEAVLQKLGVKFERVEYPGTPQQQHRKVLEDMESGIIDLYSLPGGIAPSSPALVEIGYPAFHLSMRAYTLASKKVSIETVQDLDDLRFGYLDFEGISRSPLLKVPRQQSTRDEAKRYESYADLVEALVEDEIDYTLASTGPFIIAARLQGKMDLLKVHGLPESSLPSYWIISAHGDLVDYQEPLAQILEEFEQQGHTALLLETAMKRYINQYRQLSKNR